MTTEILERPPTDDLEKESVDTSSEPERDDDLGCGAAPSEGDCQFGRAVKLRRPRKRVAVSADAERRTQRRRARVRSERLGRVLALALRVAVPGLVLVAALWILGGGGDRVRLPPPIEASQFRGVLDFATTERVGTMFQATLRNAPSPADAESFAAGVEHVVRVLKDAGYESILVLAPDGGTVVSGPLADVTIGQLGVAGT